VQQAVESDEAEDEAIAQRTSTQRDFDLIEGWEMIVAWGFWWLQGDPGVATQAPVPAQAVFFSDDDAFFGPNVSRISADQLVAEESTADEFVSKFWAEPMQSPDPLRLGTRFGVFIAHRLPPWVCKRLILSHPLPLQPRR